MTADARRLFLWACGFAVAVYLAVGGLVVGFPQITAVGRIKELDILFAEAEALDRSGFGDRPVTWIVGSSVTREAFDAKWIEAQLAAAGSAHAVRKYAYNRGAPLFSRAIIAELPVRAGDRVVTTVHYDNFRADWLDETADFSFYLQRTFTAGTILGLSELSWSDRVEFSLASLPPRGFHRDRIAFAHGLERWGGYALGLNGRPKPKRRPTFSTNRLYVPLFRRNKTVDRPLADDEMRLDVGQVNYAAWLGLQADVARVGARVITVFLPARREYDAKFLSPATLERFHAHFQAEAEVWWELPYLYEEAYMDWKHPNYLGRPQNSRALADRLIADEHLAPPVDAR